MLKYKTKYFDFDAKGVTRLQKASEEDGSTPSTYEIKARFTDDTPDSHGDIITREGTTRALPDYREWRNIRYMHQPKAVGLAKNIGVDDGADLEWNEVIVKLVDRDTIHQVQEGVLKGLSVGILFNPWDEKSCEITDEGNWKIKDYLLAEISVVDHPAHPSASVLEQSLVAVENERIEGFTPEIKNAIRSATSTEELVPLLKSLSNSEKDVEMENEITEAVEDVTLEKEGRDWDKETSRPEDSYVEPEEEEEAEEEEDVEEVDAEVEDVKAEEAEVIEEVAEVEDEVEPEAEVVAEEEAEVVEEEEAPAEEAEVEEAEEEVVEGEEVVEEVVEEEAEEVLEEEILPESNEEAEKSITVNEEDDVNDRLDRIEAMLSKILGDDAEDLEAVEAEAHTETPVADELEEVELAETTTPSNRKPNVNLGADVTDEEVDEGDANRGFTFRRKRTDGQTRIRQTLDKYSIN